MNITIKPKEQYETNNVKFNNINEILNNYSQIINRLTYQRFSMIPDGVFSITELNNIWDNIVNIITKLCYANSFIYFNENIIESKPFSDLLNSIINLLNEIINNVNNYTYNDIWNTILDDQLSYLINHEINKKALGNRKIKTLNDNETIKCKTLTVDEVDELHNKLMSGTDRQVYNNGFPNKDDLWMTPDLRYAYSRTAYNPKGGILQYRISEDLELFEIKNPEEGRNLIKRYPETLEILNEMYRKDPKFEDSQYYLETELSKYIYNIEYDGKKYDGYFEHEKQETEDNIYTSFRNIRIFNRAFNKLVFVNFYPYIYVSNDIKKAEENNENKWWQSIELSEEETIKHNEKIMNYFFSNNFMTNEEINNIKIK